MAEEKLVILTVGGKDSFWLGRVVNGVWELMDPYNPSDFLRSLAVKYPKFVELSANG